MGQATNDLMALARRVSIDPNPRELDMLLTTGERVSMSLLCMALHDHKCPAISFTGSQAGILTDPAHFNAKIIDVKPMRVERALNDNKVVVLAGFQGVDPISKEITTLGRGGSDTTAVAMAAHLGAESCQILKDVEGVYTADPRLVQSARPLEHLPMAALLNMTFWGAKVLHHRSVELALRRNVTLEIGASDTFNIGTRIARDGGKMPFEQQEVLSVNSQALVEHVFVKCADANKGAELFKNFLTEAHLPWPQLLASAFQDGALRLMFTGDADTLLAIRRHIENDGHRDLKMRPDALSSVTLTCYGAVASDLAPRVLDALLKASVPVEKVIQGPISLSLFVQTEARTRAVEVAHTFIERT
jgi:aspartate kinase